MSMIPHNTLVVVADGRAARLFRNVGDESGLKLHQETTLDASDAANDGPAGSHADSVGMGNVDARLRQVFGDDYGLVVETAPGAGTRVSFRVPKYAPGVHPG